MPDFNKVLGHDKVKQHLLLAVSQSKVSHAYLINGEQGSGKKLLASVFAQALVCMEGTPCLTCKACIQAESMNHPDIIRITHEKYSIGVDDIRIQVNSGIKIKPYSSKYKIYMIDEADKMTEQAQNALLKTVEEPPEYVVILLLTENKERLLPTILSRCVCLDLKPVSQEEMIPFLMTQYLIPDYTARVLAQFSQGNIGRAIRYGTTGNFLDMKEEILHILKYIDEMDIAEIVDAIKKLAEYKLEINDCLDLIQLWYRDVLMLKITNDPNMVLFKEEYHFLSQQISKRGYDELEIFIKAIDKAKVRLKANVNFELTIELMFLALKDPRLS